MCVVSVGVGRVGKVVLSVRCDGVRVLRRLLDLVRGTVLGMGGCNRLFLVLGPELLV